MDERQQALKDLHKYIESIDNETTLLLQNLQWDHKHLLQSVAMVSCKYIASHRIPLHSKEYHEKQCYLALNGYSKDDVLLPDPIDPKASTVVKFSKQDIIQIINTASSNPSFKRVCPGPEPLSLERLQLAYTADERRAIYDAVVSAAPACHDLTDLALNSTSDGSQTKKVKSRAEILAELRDMKRRRTKYRVAAKTRNYSDVLRDVIKTQMELYAEAKGVCIKTEYGSKSYVCLNKPSESSHKDSRQVPPPIVIKQERISPEPDSYSESSRRYNESSRSRETHKDKHRRRYDDRESKKRRGFHNDDNSSNDRESKKRRSFHNDDNSSDRRTHRNSSQDKDKHTSKEKRRYYDGQFRQDIHRTKEKESFTDRSRHDHFRKSYDNIKEMSSSNDRYDEDKRSKRDRNFGNGSSKDNNKYESNSREYDKYSRSYKETKHEEYRKSSKDFYRYRDRKQNQHDVKKE